MVFWVLCQEARPSPARSCNSELPIYSRLCSECNRYDFAPSLLIVYSIYSFRLNCLLPRASTNLPTSYWRYCVDLSRLLASRKLGSRQVRAALVLLYSCFGIGFRIYISYSIQYSRGDGAAAVINTILLGRNIYYLNYSFALLLKRVAWGSRLTSHGWRLIGWPSELVRLRWGLALHGRWAKFKQVSLSPELSFHTRMHLYYDSKHFDNIALGFCWGYRQWTASVTSSKG